MGDINKIVSAPLALGASVLGSVGNIAGSLIAGHQNRKFAREQMKFAHNEAELAYQRQVDLWNKQNQYNTPAAQMARYSAAGLNPNLIYNQEQTSASVPSVSSASPGPGASQPVPSLDVPSMLSQYNQFRQMDLNEAMNRKQLQSLDAEIEVKRAEADNIRNKTDRGVFDLNFEKDVKELRKTLLSLGVDEKDVNIAIGRLKVQEAMENIRGLRFNNDYIGRTLEDRVSSVGLGNAYLLAQKRYLESQKNLTDEQKRELQMTNQFLQDEMSFRYVNGVNALGGFTPGFLNAKAMEYPRSSQYRGVKSSYDNFRTDPTQFGFLPFLGYQLFGNASSIIPGAAGYLLGKRNNPADAARPSYGGYYDAEGKWREWKRR